MAFGDSDVAYMLGDVFSDGVKLMYTSPAGDALEVDNIFEEGDQQMVASDGDVVVNQTSILIASGSMPGVRQESLCSRAGVNYAVLDARKLDDGALTRVYLKKV